MKVLVLIFGVITNDGQIDLIKVPKSELKNIDSCEKAIEINRKWVDNPDFDNNPLPQKKIQKYLTQVFQVEH